MRLTPALANLREALEPYFEDEPVPAGSEPIVAPVRSASPRDPAHPRISGQEAVTALEPAGFVLLSS